MKRKLNKWLSGVLAACVLFTTVPVYAINDVSGTETSTEVVETSEETQSSEVETLSTEDTIQESSESAETTSEESSKTQASETADEMLNISPTDLGDEEEPSTDNWELSTVFYDSTVDNGKTPLTSIDWDASDGDYKEGTPRVITVQINYKNTNAVTTYQPGDLEISIPNLCYSNSNISGTAYDAQWSISIIVTLTSLTANEDGSYNQITGLLSSTQGLTLSKFPIGTYLITESDDIYFDFVEMVPNNDEELIIDGVTLEKTDKGYVLTISDDLSGDVEFNIKVTNKIEPDRPYEDKEEIENLFKIPSVDA